MNVATCRTSGGFVFTDRRDSVVRELARGLSHHAAATVTLRDGTTECYRAGLPTLTLFDAACPGASTGEGR